MVSLRITVQMPHCFCAKKCYFECEKKNARIKSVFFFAKGPLVNAIDRCRDAWTRASMSAAQHCRHEWRMRTAPRWSSSLAHPTIKEQSLSPSLTSKHNTRKHHIEA